jgi:mRNA interferase MazF
MSFNRGDVVLVPFPFTDLSTQKQRPALVISSNRFNTSSADIVLVGITSQIPKDLAETDYRLSSDEQRMAGLPRSSIIKAAKVVTLSQVLIRKMLGRVPARTVDQIVTRLEEIIK